ncbi:MAG: DegV family protein [Chloroflexi bacterium]|nr:DegV family protein [Chloroflexota bacterium]
MIRIITDSTCEAPPGVLGHPAVTVLPLTVVFGQTALRDGVEITREQFWERLPTSNPLPTTSQATPADFIGPFQDFTARGDEVITLVLSAKLSGTYSSAIIAQESQPGWPVDVIDSRTISVGLGLMLQEAVAMVEAGLSRAEIVARLDAMRDHVHLFFALETLEYLQRGGRIGKAQAFVGTLLKFKPLLGIVDGEVVPVTRVRSRTKALEELQDRLSQLEPARGEQVRLGLTQALVPGDAAVVSRSLAARFGTQSVFIAALGPVLGVHVGPGAIGAAVYAAK